MRPTPRASAFRTADLIALKRDGQPLSGPAIKWLITGYVSGEVTDYQMSAFTMAVTLRGMTAAETLTLTLAMRDSGRTLPIRKHGRPRLDKHSTGGVGDKVSLCLAPLIAACGARVPMISGRGLGHTGGTLDKLAAIPGFRVDMSVERFARQVDRIGLAFMGQTREIAPADSKLYALRDVTATVDSIPLITASILSKKLAANLDALVMDIKVGRGAFMRTLGDAHALADSIARVGRAARLQVATLFTAMDAPLGRAVGNALEVREAIQVLQGAGPDDLVECTLALGAEMLRRGGLARNAAGAHRMLRTAIASGRALTALESVIRAQGGDARVVREPDRLPQASYVLSLRSPQSGVVRELDALAVGHICVELGAGRQRAEDAIDPRVGLVLAKKPGERVRAGELLAEIHTSTRAAGTRARAQLLAAYTIGRRARPMPLILERRR